jgi:hypothetical protein
MITETMLLRRLQRKLGSEIYDAFDTEWYMDILNEESLITFSTYYPFLIKNIVMTSSAAIPSVQPQTGNRAQYAIYKIPKENPDDTYIGIEWSYFASNGTEGSSYSGLNPMLTDALYQKVKSLLPIPPIRFIATFEAPDLCRVAPAPLAHLDFALTMQRVRRLSEVPIAMREYFLRLFEYDVKDSIFNEFKSARTSGVYNGIEINTYIDEYSSAANDRNELLEVFEGDYFKDPSRYEVITQFGVQ